MPNTCYGMPIRQHAIIY